MRYDNKKAGLLQEELDMLGEGKKTSDQAELWHQQKRSRQQQVEGTVALMDYMTAAALQGQLKALGGARVPLARRLQLSLGLSLIHI